MKIFLILVFSFLSLFALNKDDFAYSKDIHMQKNTGLVQIRLSTEIYKSLVHSDLSDMAVFDANGQMMPQKLSLVSMRQSDSTTKDVPFVVFDALKSGEKQEVRLEYKGAQIQMLSLGNTKNEDYIVDLRGVGEAVKKLYINSEEKKYMLFVDIECSETLEKWRILKEKAVIASFDFENALLQKDSIDMPFVKCQYLRLRTEKKFPISKIRVQEYPKTTEAPLEKENIHYVNKENGLEFEVSKNLRVQDLEFTLEDKEQLYKLEVFARNSKDKQWKKIRESQIYTIVQEDKKLKKHHVHLNTNYNFYRVQAEASSYLPYGMSMSYTHQRQDLYFLAQGKAPYTLAFGSFEARLVTKGNVFLGNKDSLSQASLGKKDLMGGKERLVQIKEIPTRKYWVWFSLLLGVFLLGFISFSLYKQLDKK